MLGNHTPSTIRFDPSRDTWTTYTLIEGEVLDGEVLRLPGRHMFNGNRLFVRRNGTAIGIRATAKCGHTLLERELQEQRVRVGDHIVVRYFGMRTTVDGERAYRLYKVTHG